MNSLLLGLLALVRLAPTPSLTPEPYLGTWLVADKDARVEITRQGEVYTGRYVSFTDPAAARKKGYAVGGIVLKNLKKDGTDLTGKVIDSETKKEYNASLSTPVSDRVVLKVKTMGMTVHTETWTRVAVSAIEAPAPATKAASLGTLIPSKKKETAPAIQP